MPKREIQCKHKLPISECAECYPIFLKETTVGDVLDEQQATGVNNQVIDVETKGNVIRFYIGENGKQWGDDWDDAPYEHNAGVVYDKFVERTFDVAIPFDLFVSEPSTNTQNSEWCKQDMIERKVHCLLIESAEWGGTELLKVYFGDAIPDVAAALENIFKEAVKAAKKEAK